MSHGREGQGVDRGTARMGAPVRGGGPRAAARNPAWGGQHEGLECWGAVSRTSAAARPELRGAADGKARLLNVTC